MGIKWIASFFKKEENSQEIAFGILDKAIEEKTSMSIFAFLKSTLEKINKKYGHVIADNIKYRIIEEIIISEELNTVLKDEEIQQLKDKLFDLKLIQKSKRMVATTIR